MSKKITQLPNLIGSEILQYNILLVNFKIRKLSMILNDAIFLDNITI